MDVARERLTQVVEYVDVFRLLDASALFAVDIAECHVAREGVESHGVHIPFAQRTGKASHVDKAWLRRRFVFTSATLLC